MAGNWIKLAGSHLRKAGNSVSATPVYAVNMAFVTDVQFEGSFDGKAGSLTLGVEEPEIDHALCTSLRRTPKPLGSGWTQTATRVAGLW